MANFKQEYRLTWTPDLAEWPRSTARKAFESALHLIGAFWFKELLPKHFTAKGGREYGYQPRTKSYMIRKAKEGHQDPLVGLSRRGHQGGELRRAATRAGLVKASSARVRVELTQLPRYAFIKNPLNLDKPDELTRISAAETEMFLEKFGTELERALEHEPKRKRTTTKAA